MSVILESAIEAVKGSINSFCRFITANDVGKTGSHQSGFYIPKSAWPLLFDSPHIKGENKDRMIRIVWNDDFETDSRAIYYGSGTRNEYRITRFGKGFPYLEEKYSGDLMIFARMDYDSYKGYVLKSDEDIDGFLAYFDLAPTDLNQLIKSRKKDPEQELIAIINNTLVEYASFPSTEQMSALARSARTLAYKLNDSQIRLDPDSALLSWVDTEYKLFRAFEEREFIATDRGNFPDCQSLIEFSNSLVNRRKSRAGKSLEHHLAYIFDIEKLKFECQVITEGKKKPDFIFPDGVSYHNLLFPGEGLTFLGAKTTCKDRWRQVLNEADRIPHKHLFTLQQGISANQLEEMKQENLTLVVPESNIKTFDVQHRDNIMSLKRFISEVQGRQSTYYPAI